MEDIYAFSSEFSLLAGTSKARSSPGVALRKTLGDVTNIRPRPKLLVAEQKSEVVSSLAKKVDRFNKENETLKKGMLASKSELVPSFTEDMDRLNKENEALKKEILALKMQLTERNKITELSANELQNLRLNLQSLYQQNLQLAQANSQMLAELNSGKDRLKALNHEVGCLKGVRNVKNVSLQDEKKVAGCQQTSNKVTTIKSDAAGESLHPENTNMKRSSTDTRPKPKPKVAGQSSAKDTTEEKSENKRFSLRRKSSRFASEEPADGLLKQDDMKPVMNASIEEEKSENKRLCLRRRSSRFTSEEQPCTDALPKLDDVNPAINAGAEQEKSENKRPCLRRQPARLRSEEPGSIEDLYELDDIKLPIHAQVDEKKSTEQHNVKAAVDRNSTGSMFAEDRRMSTGRPSRRTAGKVKSYKEVPLNVKMRRSTST